MLKRASLITLALVIVIGGVLLWQWKSYSNGIDDSKKKSSGNVTQKINMEVEEHFLQVTQRIDGLESEKEYGVLVPPHAKDWSCLTASEKNDTVENEGFKRILAEDGSLTFVYRIPTGRDDQLFLLNDWTGTIQDAFIAKTSIEIADLAKRQGTWISGAPLKGVQEFEHINYYVFEGKGGTPSLYWHPSSLAQESIQNGKLSIYFDGKKFRSLSFPNIERLVNFPYTSIVLTNQQPETVGNGLIIVDSSSLVVEELERKLIDYYFYSKFENLPVKESGLIDVMSSLFLGEGSQSEKGEQLIQELKTVLTNEEIEEFVELIIHEKEILSVEKLDEWIGKVKGKNTRFFALNKDSHSLIPLYFFDPRAVYVEGKRQKDFEVVYFGEERYFPVIETFEALAYNVKVLSDKKTLLLSKDSNTYRFYEDQNIFIHNEEDYGLLERPLRVFNGEIYIKEKWLSTLFHVVIYEDTEMVKLLI